MRDWERLLFAALIFVQLVPIWSFRFFPTQDGPVTIENAHILREYSSPDFPVFREYLKINDRASPNWTIHLFLAGLMFLFPPLVAEKIVLSFYVVLFPLAVLYAVRSIRPGSSFVAVLSFPFVFNYLLHTGFYNFVFSLPIFFLLIGYRIRHPGVPSRRHAVALSTLAIALYFCHIVSLVLAIVALVVLDVSFALGDAAAEPRDEVSPGVAFIRSWWPRLVWTAIVLAPSLILSALFLGRQESGLVPRRGFRILLEKLVHADSLLGYTDSGSVAATAVAALFLAVLVYLVALKIVRKRFDRWDGLLVVAAVFTIAYFTSPEGLSGGWFMSERLNLFPFFALILWFGAQEYTRLARLAIQAVGATLAVILLSYHAIGYAEINGYLAEYTSGAKLIRPNSTLLPLCYDRFGHRTDGSVVSPRVSVFLHAAGYIGALRNVVEMDDYQANTTYFPTIWRRHLNPFVNMPIMGGEIESSPPCVDFTSYEARTGGRVDYVLLWGLDARLRHHPCVRIAFAQLSRDYDLIYTSPRGLMALYERRNDGTVREDRHALHDRGPG